MLSSQQVFDRIKYIKGAENISAMAQRRPKAKDLKMYQIQQFKSSAQTKDQRKVYLATKERPT